MVKKISVFILTLFTLNLSAQYTELGVSAGISNYQGDLSAEVTFDSLNIGITRGAAGIIARHNFNRFWALRGAFTYASVAGDDRKSTESGRLNRNLRFTTNIFEVAALVELNILGYDPQGGKRFSPYLFLGAAGYYFNPKTDYNGRDIPLQPLGTEGQGAEGFEDKYSRVSIAVPMGGGLKFALGDNWTIGAEFGARKIFHDYLDDVSGSYPGYAVVEAANGEIAASLSNRSWELDDSSPLNLPAGGARGNEKFVDWYYFSMLTLTYHLNGAGGRRSGRNIGCPGFD